jgi:type I restriction-modification system DNA methylase subunit
MIPQTFDDAFQRVKHLASVFKQNEKQYLEPSYSEAQVRLDFIDKFLIALGWDVYHEQQTNPYEQEVKVERTVSVNEARKRADYAFLDSNFRDVRFYVEAKKPNAQLNTPLNYFQTIRYGWNSQTPLAVLTDFEEFCILDCRYKPDIYTSLHRAVKKFHYSDYLDEDKFKEIYFLFSREAVTNESLEKFAASLPKPTSKAQQKKLFSGSYLRMDDAFLQELDGYREELARMFKKNNPHLNGEDLTEATQRTIDRLVFMRFLEDKLIEPDTLVEKFCDKGHAWQDFVATSHCLDAIYNGIIFKKHPIVDASNFRVEDQVFADICASLTDANSPYAFHTIPIHTLGSIYERFLGKVIIATEEGVQIDEKPEVRKAGGVFYTPENIVTYIIENTVGKLIEGKTPEQVAQMRFADIACGSGSFLLGVYDYLLRYHAGYYNQKKNYAKGLKAGCIKHEDGTLHLSLRQKKKILQKNIYGVDFDMQAVEVAQLSLYLKLLEEETTATATQLEFRETMLPSLDKNIVHGNSLVGWDIIDGLFDDEEQRKLYPLDFTDKFKEIMKEGGFDAIVGNPPYISVQSGYIEKKVYDYLEHRYTTMERISDYFCLFTERAIKLLKDNGYWGYIIPSTVMMNLSFTRLRKHLLEKTSITNITHLGDGVFSNAVVPTCVVAATKRIPRKNLIRVLSGSRNPYDKETRATEIEQDAFLALENYVFNLSTNKETQSLLRKISSNSVELGSLVDIKEGIKTGNDRIFLSEYPFPENSYQLVKGRNIERYKCQPNLYLNYDPQKLSRPQKPEHFLVEEKLFVRRVGDSLIATYDDQQLFCVHTLYTARKRETTADYSLKFILGLLNSKLFNFYYHSTSVQKGSVFPEVRIYSLNQLPIRAVNFSDETDNKAHDKIVQLVEQLLQAKLHATNARNERDQVFYQNKCLALDRQIDQLVYDLYDLTDKERNVVENG